MSVPRTDVEQVSQLLAGLVLDRLPAPIADVVRSLAQPLLGAVTVRLTELVDPKATALVTVYFHVAGEPGDPPEQAADGPDDAGPDGATGRGTIPTGCPSVSTIGNGIVENLGSFTEPTGGRGCLYAHRAPGTERTQLGIGLGPGRVDHSDDPDARPVTVPGADAAWFTCCYLSLLVVAGDRTMLINGDGYTEAEFIDIATRVLRSG